MSGVTKEPDSVVVPILCEIYDVSVNTTNGASELLVAGDALHIEQDDAGLTVGVGQLSLVLDNDGVMEMVQTPSGWALLFPHAGGKVFSLQVYPKDGDEEHVKAILSFFGQMRPVGDSTASPDFSKAVEERGKTSQKIAGSISAGGEWFAKQIVKSGAAAAAYIDKKGKEYVEGRQSKDVAVSKQTQARLDMARSGAGYILRGTAVGLSFTVAGFKTVGNKAAEMNRRTGALDKLSAEVARRTGREPTGVSKSGRVVVEVGTAGIDAAMDVYHAVKLAADVVTDQSERTAVQVAGDLYGEDVRLAAQSGVGAVADIGRAGAKVLQFAGDEVEVAMECAIEFVDQTFSIDDFLKASPICECALRRCDPMTFRWSDRFASLSELGLILFRDIESMQSKDPKRPPQNIVSADDMLDVKGEDTNIIVLRTRDNVIHRFEFSEKREAWLDALVKVQANSRRFRALAGGSQVQCNHSQATA